MKFVVIHCGGTKVLNGHCSICSRKQCMTVSDSTKFAEGLVDFFENLGEKGLNLSKKMAKNVLRIPGRALDITSNVACAVASRNPKAILSTLPELINFYTTGKFL